MMHLAYPNVIDRQFRACVRYISALQNPVPSVYTSTSDAPPNTPNLATLRAVTHRLAPEWSTQGGYKVRLYEKADVRGTWQGASLDLAYLLASIRCVRSLRLEAFVDAGDVWCTGAIGALESGAPRLRAVAAAEFAAKLAGFVAQPHDRFFLVPAANIHTQLYELCATHDVQVLPLADLQQALPDAVAARRWAGQAVILIEEDQLQALVATLFAPPLSAAAPTDDPPTPEPMLRRPYKFLAAFAREDADLFYGRTREIRRLQSLLPMARVLILHGASGTGKTSLLQAGLLPRLPPARYAAVQVRIVDDEPTRAIKAALLRAFRMAPRSLDLPLLDVLTAATAAVGKAVVVILDQFEELFLRFPPVVRQGLQQELGACVAAPLAVHFVLALREDYLAPLAEFQDTIPTLLTHTLRLTRLPVAQALDAVVEPARRLGITVDETLIREISYRNWPMLRGVSTRRCCSWCVTLSTSRPKMPNTPALARRSIRRWATCVPSCRTISKRCYSSLVPISPGYGKSSKRWWRRMAPPGARSSSQTCCPACTRRGSACRRRRSSASCCAAWCTDAWCGWTRWRGGRGMSWSMTFWCRRSPRG